MEDDSTPIRPTQREDYIDYRVSDLFRDHYAAQGLTYPAGRRQEKAPIPIPVWTDETDALHERKRELELEVRLLRLENDQLRRHARVPEPGPAMPTPTIQTSNYRGVDPDGIASH